MQNCWYQNEKLTYLESAQSRLPKPPWLINEIGQNRNQIRRDLISCDEWTADYVFPAEVGRRMTRMKICTTHCFTRAVVLSSQPFNHYECHWHRVTRESDLFCEDANQSMNWSRIVPNAPKATFITFDELKMKKRFLMGKKHSFIFKICICQFCRFNTQFIYQNKLQMQNPGKILPAIRHFCGLLVASDPVCMLYSSDAMCSAQMVLWNTWYQFRYLCWVSLFLVRDTGDL